MVYHAAQESLLIFGGRNNKSADIDMNDLWAYETKGNGSSQGWHKLSGGPQSNSILTVERTTL